MIGGLLHHLNELLCRACTRYIAARPYIWWWWHVYQTQYWFRLLLIFTYILRGPVYIYLLFCCICIPKITGLNQDELDVLFNSKMMVVLQASLEIYAPLDSNSSNPGENLAQSTSTVEIYTAWRPKIPATINFSSSIEPFAIHWYLRLTFFIQWQLCSLCVSTCCLLMATECTNDRVRVNLRNTRKRSWKALMLWFGVLMLCWLPKDLVLVARLFSCPGVMNVTGHLRRSPGAPWVLTDCGVRK